MAVLWAMSPEAPVTAAAAPAPASCAWSASEPKTRIYIGGVGVSGTARWGRRGEEGGAVQSRTLLLGGVQARLVGYAGDRPRFGGGRRFVTPDLRLSLELGDSISPRSRVLGTQGALQIGLGRSLASRVSPYGRLQLDTRFAAYLHDIAEGNFVSTTLRGSAGLLGRTRDESLVVLAGATLDGVAGAMKLGPRSTFAQVMNGAELMLVAQPRDEVAVVLGGEVRVTRLGERTGGRRIEGRASLEVSLSGVSLYLWYTGTRIEADLPLGGGARFHELRRGHALQLGFGINL